MGPTYKSEEVKMETGWGQNEFADSPQISLQISYGKWNQICQELTRNYVVSSVNVVSIFFLGIATCGFQARNSVFLDVNLEFGGLFYNFHNWQSKLKQRKIGK